MDIKKLQALVVDALEDIKAQDILLYDTTHLTSLFDSIAIASGTSNRQTKALAASVRDKIKSNGGQVLSIEGEDTGEWVLVDLGDMVVHIMQPAIRAYYRLEEIWGDKPVKVTVRKNTSKSARTASKTTASKPSDKTAPAKKAVAKKAPAKQTVARKVAKETAETGKPAKTAAVKTAAAKTTAARTSAASAAKKAPAKAPAKAPVKAPARKAPAKKAPAKTTGASPTRKTPVRAAKNKSV